MRRPLPILVAALLAGALSVAACGGDSDTDTGGDAGLPAASTLLPAAAAKMRAVTSTAFTITTDGETGALPISSAEGAIDNTGTAQGKAQLDQLGMALELTFVVKDGTVYLNGLTGGWQKMPLAQAAAIYDPTAILDPDKGIASVLASAQGTTQKREGDDYVVDATFDGAAMAGLVPGVTGEVKGTVWIGVDEPLVRQLRFTVPGQTGTATIAFSDFDKPVNVEVPKI